MILVWCNSTFCGGADAPEDPLPLRREDMLQPDALDELAAQFPSASRPTHLLDDKMVRHARRDMVQRPERPEEGHDLDNFLQCGPFERMVSPPFPTGHNGPGGLSLP